MDKKAQTQRATHQIKETQKCVMAHKCDSHTNVP